MRIWDEQFEGCGVQEDWSEFGEPENFRTYTGPGVVAETELMHFIGPKEFVDIQIKGKKVLSYRYIDH